jgi:glycosyltransferase involved in cell wall biosynthesis
MARGRLALHHQLGPGGALRFVDVMMPFLVEEWDITLIEVGTATLVDPPEGVTRVVVRTSSRRPGHVGHLLDIAAVLRAERSVARLIEDGHFDVALVHPSSVTQAPAMLGWVKRVPTTYYAQEVRRLNHEAGYAIRRRAGSTLEVVKGRADTGLQALLGQVDRWAMAAATSVCANSWFSAESISRVYGREAAVVPLGVDPDAFTPADVPRRDLVAVGGLEPFKRHDQLIRSVALLPPGERPPLRIVTGRPSPEERRYLEQLAYECGVELTIAESVSDADLVQAYRSALATCCVASLEPFGLTVLESVACGTPVVAVAEGGYRETVRDGVNGLLVARSDEAIAEGIRRVMRTSWDRMTIRSTISEEQTWPAVARRLGRHLAEVAGR